jgi:hypothetical protein
MSKEDESNMTVLKTQLAEGEYRVDVRQVADAILNHPGFMTLFDLRRARAGVRVQQASEGPRQSAPVPALPVQQFRSN